MFNITNKYVFDIQINMYFLILQINMFFDIVNKYVSKILYMNMYL